MTRRRNLLAIAVVTLFLVVVAGFWAYRQFGPQRVQIRNESDWTLYVGAHPKTVLCPTIFVAPRSVAQYGDTWICRRPDLEFVSPSIEIACEWRAARRNQPVVVTHDSVSCHPGVIPTPISPPRPFPTPTPGRSP